MALVGKGAALWPACLTAGDELMQPYILQDNTISVNGKGLLFSLYAAYPVLTKWAVIWAVRLMWFPAPFATVNPWNLCGAQHRVESEQSNDGSQII